jgi:hypothetical protein
MQAWLNGDASSAYVTYDESLTAPYRRLIALDFSGTGAAGAVGLAEEELRGQYNLYADPQDGAYHMQVWPGNLAWSVLGKICLGPYRLETNATIGANSPDGYAGLMGRFQNARNFYLFAVNGEGAFRVSLLQDGEWRSIQPWTPSPAVHEAGKSNALALTDDGRTLVFYSNDTPLYTLDALDLPAGNVGLAAGATTTPTAVSASITAPMAALACNARLKPVLAAAMSGCAMSSGSWAAAPIAPPRVSPAARASVSLSPLGMAVSMWLRYSAAPILPITAIPSAMPSSVAVSDVAEAAPALRAGAALTTMSVPRIIIGMTPMPMMVMPM